MFGKGAGITPAPLPRGERQGGVCQQEWCGPQRSEDPVLLTDGGAAATLNHAKTKARSAYSICFAQVTECHLRPEGRKP